MNQNRSASLIFLFSALAISILLYFKISYHSLQLITLFLLMVILVLVEYTLRKVSIELTSRTRNGFLLLFTLFVELLVVSTGGVGSHFILMSSLFILALSLLINITSALIFLVSFFSLLGFQIYQDENIQIILGSDPTILLLMVLTFVIVGSLAIILNEYYHLKDVFVEVLKKKVNQNKFHEQSVLSNLSELIIITDIDLNIVSVNDAVEKAILHSESELLKKNLFQVLSLRDERGTLLTAETIPLTNIPCKSLQMENIRLHTAVGENEDRFAFTVKPILDLEGKLYQLIVILRKIDIADSAWQDDSHVLDQVITKQQAMIEDIRMQLAKRGIDDLVFKVALVGKLDREVRSLIDLKSNLTTKTETKVDVMRIVKNTCEVLNSFAEKVHVRLEQSPYSLEQTEGSNADLFFAQIDLLWFDVLIHKLMEIAILLSSSSQDKTVVVTVQQASGDITVMLRSSNTQLDSKDIEKLFTLNFGDLQSRTNLKLASGLEGYIAQQISMKIALPIITKITPNGIELIVKLSTVRDKSTLDM